MLEYRLKTLLRFLDEPDQGTLLMLVNSRSCLTERYQLPCQIASDHKTIFKGRDRKSWLGLIQQGNSAKLFTRGQYTKRRTGSVMQTQTP